MSRFLTCLHGWIDLTMWCDDVMTNHRLQSTKQMDWINLLLTYNQRNKNSFIVVMLHWVNTPSWWMRFKTMTTPDQVRICYWFVRSSLMSWILSGLRVIRFLAMYLLDPSKLDDIVTKVIAMQSKFVQEKTFYIVAAILHMHHQNLKDALTILAAAPHGSVEV